MLLFDQKLHNFKLALLAGIVERCTAMFVLDVTFTARLRGKELDNICMAIIRGQMKWGNIMSCVS